MGIKTARQPAADRRLSLLQAALDLFSTVGFDGTTTKAVAERVGVTEALLFKHFRSKQELLRAVVAELGPRRQLTVHPEGTADMPVRSALAVSLTLYLDAFWLNRACLRMMILECWRDPLALQELREQLAEGTQRLEEMLEYRAAKGELNPALLPALTDVIAAAIGGFVFRSLREEPDDWDQARTEFIDNLMQILFIDISPCT